MDENQIFKQVALFLKAKGMEKSLKRFKKDCAKINVSIDENYSTLPTLSQLNAFYFNGNDSTVKVTVEQSGIISSNIISTTTTNNDSMDFPLSVDTSIEQPPQPLNEKKRKAKTMESEKKAEKERFQRVKANQVEFLDSRLRDNTFMSKSGAFGSYGQKAHEDLIVTKGKGFLKAKNKKKKGSYRGGPIDMGSHSIKFNVDSD